jgi:hypothetical protein
VIHDDFLFLSISLAFGIQCSCSKIAVVKGHSYSCLFTLRTGLG